MSSVQFSRSAILYGDAAQKKFGGASAMLFGVGAVGSFAAEVLARVGVGRFILVDADVVDESNINRQLCALHSTIGLPKAEVMKARLLDINPAAKVEAVAKFVDAENAEEFLSERPTVVLDAIDALASKSALIAAALRANVAVVSSMGAARKTDVSKIKEAEIFKTSVCPIAARIRKDLRAAGFKKGNMCVFSTEELSAESHVKSGSAGEKKIIGSTPIVTGSFGLRLAGLAISEILADS